MTNTLRICLLILFSVLLEQLSAQDIPDLKFREAIAQQCPACIDIDGNLTTAADTLAILVANDDSISDITGIDGFIELTEFYCNDNLIGTIPVLPDSLHTFFCSNNGINIFPAALPSKLLQLKCEKNYLTSLPPLPATLSQLFCSDNHLTSLPILPPVLDNLTCNSNALSALPALPSLLTSLHCNLNHLTKLPALPASLLKLYCSQNLLSSLPQLPSSLSVLDVSGNPISCLPLLPMNIQTLIYDFTNINCFPNFPYIFQVASPLPLCLAEDSAGCALNPKVNGTVFLDYNANGVKDGSDVYANGIELTADSSNWMAITNSQGKYAMSVGLNNTLTITPVTPPGIYTIVPATLTFTTDDSSAQQFTNADFALQPSATNYDLDVSLLAGMALPSGSAVYTITLQNKSAFSIEGSLQMVYDQNLAFVSSDLATSSQVGYTLTWDFTSLLPFSSKSINVVFNVSGNEGDSLTCSVNGTITGHADIDPSNNSQTLTNVVSGSLLSNYLAVSDDTITPYDVAAGKYLEYTLHFRNAGPVAANKLEVFDTLSSLLIPSTFDLIGISHPYTLEITNAEFTTDHSVVLHWTFAGSEFPPVSVDSVNSEGIIDFKVKVSDDVYQNAIIRNTAYILFGYSSTPIVSNNAITIVEYPVGIASMSNSEAVQIMPNPFSDLISITMNKNSLPPIEIILYDLVGKRIQERTISQTSSRKFNFDLSSLSQGTYLVTVKTRDGVSSFKILKQ